MEEPTPDEATEREIDQILADSFPASDAPPWTPGIAKASGPPTAQARGSWPPAKTRKRE